MWVERKCVWTLPLFARESSLEGKLCTAFNQGQILRVFYTGRSVDFSLVLTLHCPPCIPRAENLVEWEEAWAA